VEKRDRGLDHIIEVKQLGDRVTGGFSWRGRTYRLDGKITGDRYVTGTWRDDVEGVTHHGAFQLIIGPHARTMKGRWLGFSFARNVVNAGDWEWRRVEPSLSSVEAGGAQPQEVDLPSAPGTSSQG
jgi:hypothetical protein